MEANIISAGYCRLIREGWTEYRHGCGVYIKPNVETPSTPEQILDQRISVFFAQCGNSIFPQSMCGAGWRSGSLSRHSILAIM
jgi:hypothetical protein